MPEKIVTLTCLEDSLVDGEPKSRGDKISVPDSVARQLVSTARWAVASDDGGASDDDASDAQGPKSKK